MGRVLQMSYRVINQQREILVQNGPGNVVTTWEGSEDLIGREGFCAGGRWRRRHLTHPQHRPHYFTAGLSY